MLGGGSLYPKYPYFRGPISQFQRWDITISGYLTLFSKYSNLRMDIPIYTLSQKKRNISEVAFLLEKSVYQ